MDSIDWIPRDFKNGFKSIKSWFRDSWLGKKEMDSCGDCLRFIQKTHEPPSYSLSKEETARDHELGSFSAFLASLKGPGITSLVIVKGKNFKQVCVHSTIFQAQFQTLSGLVHRGALGLS